MSTTSYPGSFGSPEWREAYDRTDEALVRIEGLTRALYMLAQEHPVLGSSDPDAEALVSLILVLEEKAKQASKRHSDEWAARRQEDRGSPG